MIRVIVDSTCDFTLEEAESLGVKVVPLNTNIDGKDYKDRVDLTPEEFYTLLENAQSFPKTSQPSPEDFLASYKEGIEAKDDIIVVTVSSHLSGTCQSANLAKMISEYEDHIYVVDSQTGTHAAKLIALKAVELAKANHDFKYVCDYLDEYKTRVKLFAVVDTLDYFLMGGRIDKTSAMVGNLLKLKPILTVVDGKLDVTDKKRGTKKATTRIVELMQESGEIDFDEPAIIAYTGNDIPMEAFENTIKESFAFKTLLKGNVGPVVGSHAGPGARLIAYVQK